LRFSGPVESWDWAGRHTTGPLVDWARRDAPVIAALTTLMATKNRGGFWKCGDRLRLDGQGWNHTRLWRVYCQLRLNLP
jgi:putative transposase